MKLLGGSIDRPLKVYRWRKTKTTHQQAIKLDRKDFVQPKMEKEGATKDREDSVQPNMGREEVANKDKEYLVQPNVGREEAAAAKKDSVQQNIGRQDMWVILAVWQ